MTVRIRDAVRTLADYPLRDLDDRGVRIRLHRNEAPSPPPACILDAVRSLEPDALRTYPTDLQREVTAALAARFGFDASWLVVTNGADEALAAIARTVLEPGEAMITVRPTYGIYARVAQIAGARRYAVPYRSRWSVDPASIVSEARRTNAPLIVLGNPNNPTGDALAPDALATIAEALPETLIVIDEVYLSIERHSLLPMLRAFDTIAVVGSFSKRCALAGERIGYVVAAPAFVAALRRVVGPYPLAATALAAARAYLRGGVAIAEFERRLDEQMRRSLDAIAAALVRGGFRFWRGAAPFLLADFGPLAGTIATRLAENGIAVRCFDDDELATMLRFGTASEPETSEVVRILDAVRMEAAHA